MELKLGDYKCILLSISFLCLIGFGHAGRGRNNKRKNNLLLAITTPSPSPSNEMICGPCDTRTCSYINAEECEGQIVKDECDCCPVCQAGTIEPIQMTEVYNESIVYSQTEVEEKCQKIQCPKPQKCMLNIQNIPVCRCPSPIWCRQDDRKEICGSNGKTYKNKCFFQVDECGDRKLSIVSKGPCLSADGELPTGNIKWMGRKGDRKRKNKAKGNPIQGPGEGKNSKKNRKLIKQQKRKEKNRNKKERRKNRQRQSDKRERF